MNSHVFATRVKLQTLSLLPKLYLQCCRTEIILVIEAVSPSEPASMWLTLLGETACLGCGVVS